MLPLTTGPAGLSSRLARPRSWLFYPVSEKLAQKPRESAVVVNAKRGTSDALEQLKALSHFKLSLEDLPTCRDLAFNWPLGTLFFDQEALRAFAQSLRSLFLIPTSIHIQSHLRCQLIHLRSTAPRRRQPSVPHVHGLPSLSSQRGAALVIVRAE